MPRLELDEGIFMSAAEAIAAPFSLDHSTNRPNLRLVVDNAHVVERVVTTEKGAEFDRFKGRVALEGLQARYDAVTEFAELVDGQMYTELDLTFDFNDDDLYGPDGRSLSEAAAKGLEKAEEAAKSNPNLWFEVERRRLEKEEIKEAKQMVRNFLQGNSEENTLAVTSDYPDVLRQNGTKAAGYNDNRQQAMDRIIAVLPDGKIKLYSQTLDASNRQALEAMDRALGFITAPGQMLGQRRRLALSGEEQVSLSHRRRDIYDASMTDQFGGQWFAGRTPLDYRNTYEFVCRPEQKDLVDAYVSLKLSGQLTDKVMYDLAATMNARFSRYKALIANQENRVYDLSAMVANETTPSLIKLSLWQEIRAEGDSARAKGQSFVACGSTWSSEASNGELGSVGYGNNQETMKSWHGGKIYKNRKCVSCEKTKGEVGVCNVCEDCVKNPKKHKVGTIQGKLLRNKETKEQEKQARVYSLQEARRKKLDMKQA